MLWLILTLVLLVLFYLKVKKAHNYWKEKGVKCLESQFFFGNFKFWGKPPLFEQFLEMYNQFPDERYHGIYQFLQPILILKDPDLIKQVTVKEFDSFLDHRAFIDPDVDPFWSRNLFAATGNKWRDLRPTLSPSFTSSKMKTMFPLIDEVARNFVQYFEEEGKQNQIQELEMREIITRYTNDVIATTAFGLKCDSLKDKNNDFYLMGKEASDFTGLKVFRFIIPMISTFLSKLLRVKIISNNTANYFTKIIVDTIETREKNNIVRPDMIHLLMEAQKGRHKKEEEIKINEGFSSVEESAAIQHTKQRELTTEDIVAQAFIFFLAGFETVSTAMALGLYELAINPDVQTSLREEILSVEGEVTYEKILSLKYLDMVVSEVLRKWPPTMIADRKVTKPFTIQPVKPGEKPVHLNVGVICWLNQCGLHRDPKYFPEPERFDPERFSEENRHNINPSIYVPFGLGPRNCIGSRFALLEMKLLIYHALKSFEIVPISRTQIPLILQRMALRPKDGNWLGFKKINL